MSLMSANHDAQGRNSDDLGRPMPDLGTGSTYVAPYVGADQAIACAGVASVSPVPHWSDGCDGLDDVLDIAMTRAEDSHPTDAFRLISDATGDATGPSGSELFAIHSALADLLSAPAPSATQFVDEDTVRMVCRYSVATRAQRDREIADLLEPLEGLPWLLDAVGLTEPAEEPPPPARREPAQFCRHRVPLDEPRPLTTVVTSTLRAHAPPAARVTQRVAMRPDFA